MKTNDIILQALLQAEEEKKACALATIVQTVGSVPRGAGSKIVVFADRSIIGSVGGGSLEMQVIEDALHCISNKESIFKKYENHVDVGGDITPCGEAAVFIECFEGAPELVVCGAGHVGAALIELAAALGYFVTVVDTRDTDVTREHSKKAGRLVIADSFSKGIQSLATPQGTYFMVCTYDHEHDFEALGAVLGKDAGYIGMMGSSGKISSIFAKLRSLGFREELLESVHSPVGLDIGGQTPNEIALSIMAQIQMTRYKKTGLPAKIAVQQQPKGL
ncbi:MAG: XdhC/CoxI family protein [Eubacteriaceae bacterium]|nr:XdhC/CoxI family protein [Eubacteriaceae bacterium]